MQARQLSNNEFEKRKKQRNECFICFVVFVIITFLFTEFADFMHEKNNMDDHGLSNIGELESLILVRPGGGVIISTLYCFQMIGFTFLPLMTI